jgi:3-hydroxyacyl-[acyl-carrier-protein] dehydratase
MMNIEEIRATIPHRYPFLFVDRVLEITLHHSLKAIKNVTANDAFFNGHFPQESIMPGVLIIEALAQAFAILANKSCEEKGEEKALFLFAGIEKTRFRRVVVPGDQLLLEVELLPVKHAIYKGLGTASVNGEIACVTTLTSVRKKIEGNES